MSVLPNKSKDCFRAIKAAIAEQIAALEGARQIHTRNRYADNLDQWIELAAVTIGEESRLQVIFVYLADFRTAKKQFGTNDITAQFIIEVVFGFREGTDLDNSTLAFEDELGNINDLFLDEEALGFTDVSSNPVLNNPIAGDPATGQAPEYVDGVLAHRKLLTLEVTFRIK